MWCADQFAGTDAEGAGQAFDCIERRIGAATLDLSNELVAQPRLLRESFLREPSRQPQFTHSGPHLPAKFGHDRSIRNCDLGRNPLYVLLVGSIGASIRVVENANVDICAANGSKGQTPQ